MRRFARQHQPPDFNATHSAGDKHTRPHREHGGSSFNNRSIRGLSALSAGHNGRTEGRAQKASEGFVWRPDSPCSHQIATRVAERDLKTETRASTLRFSSRLRFKSGRFGVQIIPKFPGSFPNSSEEEFKCIIIYFDISCK